ncbi:hypothetical protein [Bradyrhizobium sp. CCBAU 45384]|uniref:hypothetical protein n=1 Tax=Bradyrhizobium sp. CCBAU 45384 TaxID=858428 RepID=UPI002306BFF0|nr:hypothetical protein [Bradyrhizobium sp. CCBAU 45384]
MRIFTGDGVIKRSSRSCAEMEEALAGVFLAEGREGFMCGQSGSSTGKQYDRA